MEGSLPAGRGKRRALVLADVWSRAVLSQVVCKAMAWQSTEDASRPRWLLGVNRGHSSEVLSSASLMGDEHYSDALACM